MKIEQTFIKENMEKKGKHRRLDFLEYTNIIKKNTNKNKKIKINKIIYLYKF